MTTKKPHELLIARATNAGMNAALKGEGYDTNPHGADEPILRLA